MAEKFWWNTVTKKKHKFSEGLFLALLILLSAFYRLGLEIKKFLYALKIFKPRSFGARIICAGNITMGGTGKTPFIEELAKRLTREEKNVLIVCKGYKRQKLHPIDVVSDGHQLMLKQRNAGDEAYMLARAVPKAKVVVAGNKIKGIEFGVALYRPDYVLLDDGFQKRHALTGASHVVLVDALNPAGYNRLFPAGILREPFSAIRDADAVVLTNTNLANPEIVEKLRNRVVKFNKNLKVFDAEHQPKYVYNVSTGEKQELSFLQDKKILAFSSIGNPHGFERTLRALGAHIITGIRFRDHHRLLKKEMESLMKLYDRTRAQAILTTEKDEVKLSRKHIVDNRVFALKIGMNIKNMKELEKRLRLP
ncbi:MAG: tetraacyldisaccharide 4'-kinase [Spirochaetia bacterium]|nr:tetraacyldisaccharide 4'-kinase [Spirochaetia bacterium]